ncbi:MAG: hypothetical protein LBG52_05590 [Candidatus Peribacteria bacterium]|nr:hypothetical protein [Candidatus Peribacteria bacterium]
MGWEGFSPYFSTASIATIERGVPYCVNLKSSQSMVIPLFLDNKISSHKDFLIEAKSAQFSHFDESQTKGFSATITPTGRSVYFGIFAFSGDQMEEMLGMISQIGKNFSVLRNDDAEGVWSSIFANSTARKYFTILNGESSDIAVCIESRETAFAISMADISVWSHYGDTEV